MLLPERERKRNLTNFVYCTILLTRLACAENITCVATVKKPLLNEDIWLSQSLQITETPAKWNKQHSWILIFISANQPSCIQLSRLFVTCFHSAIIEILEMLFALVILPMPKPKRRRLNAVDDVSPHKSLGHLAELPLTVVLYFRQYILTLRALKDHTRNARRSIQSEMAAGNDST